jgi:hypothetical protein
VGWKILSMPKSLGGWGLKDLLIFGHALVSKSLQTFLTREAYGVEFGDR